MKLSVFRRIDWGNQIPSPWWGLYRYDYPAQQSIIAPIGLNIVLAAIAVWACLEWQEWMSERRTQKIAKQIEAERRERRAEALMQLADSAPFKMVATVVYIRPGTTFGDKS